ncbi:MAG: aminopeptidase [Promethearchaeota archaeon]
MNEWKARKRRNPGENKVFEQTSVEIAKLAVNYSLEVKPGDAVLIRGSELAADLLRAAFVEVLRAGGNPHVDVRLSGLEELLMHHADDDQLWYLNYFDEVMADGFDKFLFVRAEHNPRRMESFDAERVKRYNSSPKRLEMLSDFYARDAEGKLKWVLVPAVCDAFAQEAGMDLYAYERFVRWALRLEQGGDPVEQWRRFEERQEALVQRLSRAGEIRVVGPDTNLTLSVAGRKWINCAGRVNLPDGEVFTGPVEDSVEGTIRFTFPVLHKGHTVRDARLTFREGRVVEATAAEGEDYFKSLVAVEGGDRVGEFAFGTNYAIDRFTRNILFDEKMGGTIHLALGLGFPATGSLNKSSIHIDLIKDMSAPGARAYVDGELFYEGGKFTGWDPA